MHQLLIFFAILISLHSKAQDTVYVKTNLEEGMYVNGKKEGVWIKYHEDGKTPKLKGEYVNGKPNGYFVKTWRNTRIRETGHYAKNQYHDTVKRYHENGQLEYEAWYDENGKEQGQVTFYYPSGQIEYTYCAKDGRTYDLYHYDTSGKLIDTQKNPIICRTPKVDKTVICTETDTIPPPRIVDPATMNMPFKPNDYNKVINEDKEIWQDGTFKDGKLWDGKIYVYDRDGILLKVRIYKAGVYCCDGQL